MKALLIVLRRVRAHLQIRALEISLQGQRDAAAQICCATTRASIQRATETTHQALRQARADYAALPRPPQNRSWRAA